MSNNELNRKMKSSPILLFILLLFSCNQNEKTNETTIKADTLRTTPSGSSSDTTAMDNNEGTLLSISHFILLCLKKKDFYCLAEYVHPTFGIRFSPYGYVDTIIDKRFSKEKLKELSKNNNKLTWGSYDGSGEKINLTPASYLQKFVYDVDFLKAKEKTVNQRKYRGTVLHNIDSIYTPCNSVEFFFSGFDPKYDGMDWRALYLIFKTESGKLYLVGVIHDQWTI